MKKILIVLLVLGLMASVSMAAKAPVARAVTSSASNMKIGFGVDNGLGAMKFMGDTWAASAMLAFSNTSAAGQSNSTFGIGGKYTVNLTGGTVPTHAGGGLTYYSMPNNTTSFTISGIYGAETVLAEHLNIGFDLYPLTFTSLSQGGASQTTFSILTGTVYGYFLF